MCVCEYISCVYVCMVMYVCMIQDIYIPAEVISMTTLTAMSFVGNGTKELPMEIGDFR